MIFKELLEQMQTGMGWYGITEHLLKIYPDQQKNADAYLTATAEMLIIPLGDPEGFSLHVEMVTEPGDFDDEDFKPWGHVFGKNGKTNLDISKESGHPVWEDPTPEQLEWLGKEAAWAIELSPWEELLAMEVVTDLPLPDALAHILWEITFFGYSNDDVKGKNSEIMSDYDEAKQQYGGKNGK